MPEPTSEYAALVERARAVLQVPAAPEVLQTVKFLESIGASSMPVGTFEGSFFDEYVEEALVVYQASITDPDFIAARLTDEERSMFFEYEDEDEDDEDWDGYDVKDIHDPEWDPVADELDSGQRVVIVLERDRHQPHLVGNFRVHGAGQWVREALWAATGVVPRDPGGYPFCQEYNEASDLARPGRPDLPVPMHERLPGSMWTTYLRVMRPFWRRARRAHLLDNNR